MIRSIALRGSTHGRRSPHRGQALVEFAFVAPIFFLILFGIIDFGRYVYYVQILNNAAREGARYAIVHGSNSFQPSGPTAGRSDDRGGSFGTTRSASSAVGRSSIHPTGSIRWGHRTPRIRRATIAGSKVHVTVTYDFHSLIPIVPIPPITINGESTLVINN